MGEKGFEAVKDQNCQHHGYAKGSPGNDFVLQEFDFQLFLLLGYSSLDYFNQEMKDFIYGMR